LADENVIVVEGLPNLIRSFDRINRDLGKGVREAIQNAAQPVADEAAARAKSQISGMARSKIPWWSMRTGSLGYGSYIAPLQRGVKYGKNRKPTVAQEKRRRPDFKYPMRAEMEIALQNNQGRVRRAVGEELEELARAWGRRG